MCCVKKATCNKTIAPLIPARSGSKRIPHKNIKELGGIPLLAWSIMSALEAFGQVYVSTDSRVYAEIALKWGAEVVIRPPELAADGVGDREVIAHFLSEHPFDLVMYLRSTTPFRTQTLLVEALNAFALGQGGPSGLRSVEEMAESAHKCFYVEPGPRLCPIYFGGVDLTDKPNQECPRTYHPNGYIDIARSEVVLAGGLWGDDVMAFVTPRTVELDTPEDWEFAEYLVREKGRRWERG